MNARRAFTLIETVLAVALSAAIMLACAEFIFLLIKTSGQFEGKWSLRGHADGVERFLRASLLNSAISDISGIEEKLYSLNKNSVLVAKLPAELRENTYHIVFSARKPHPFYLSATSVSPEKLCYLAFKEEDGLSIIWHFYKPEYRDKEIVIYKTPVSKFVKSVSYIYPEDALWKETPILDTRITAMPQFIKLTFEHNGEEIARIISLAPIVDYQISQ